MSGQKQSQRFEASLDSAVSVPEGVLFQELEGEAVLLNLNSGSYFGLDEVGTRMWNALVENSRVRPAYETLLQEYDVSEERLAEELLKLIDELAGSGLLQINVLHDDER